MSTATVSRVLNHHPLVTEETALKVKRAIDELEYRPNRLARGLSTRRSQLLGLSVPDLQGDYYGRVVTAADGAARARGYHLLVTSHEATGDLSEINFQPDVVDAAMVMLTESLDSPRALEAFRRAGTPVVVLGHESAAPDFPHIAFDNRVGTREAAEHLVAGTSPERCYYVGGPATNTDARQRAEAFEAVLRDRGVGVRAEQLAFGKYSVEHGASWAERMRERGLLRGAAVLAGNDEIAAGIVNEARDHGLRLPLDLRVVGFDDGWICRLLRPALSSVRTPKQEMAEQAVEVVTRWLERGRGAIPESIALPTRLVVRESA